MSQRQPRLLFRRMRRRLRAVPPALSMLLAVTACVGLSWALLLPPGQAPDESAHFGYVQTLAERFELPDTKPGNTFSTEQELGEDYANVRQTAAQPLTKPEWAEQAEEEWERRQDRLGDAARADGGHLSPVSGSNPARTNPPLYYLVEAVPYVLAGGGDMFDRLYLMRIWSVALLLVATAAAWLFVGEVVGPRRTLQLVGAALVGLFPMASFTASSLSPDAALISLWALALWLGARLARRGPTLAPVLGLAAVSAAAVLTKATGYALVPAAALVIAGSLWVARRRHALERPVLARRGAAAAIAFLVPVGAWLALAMILGRRAVNELPGSGGVGVSSVSLPNYLWQFYLPKLPFQAAIPPFPRLPAFDVWVKTGWGAFGWQEVRFPNWIYVVLGVVSALIVAAGLIAMRRNRRPGDALLAAFVVVAGAALLAGLHWVEWRSLVNQGVMFNQGRYLLPILPVFGALAASALRLVPRGGQVAVAGVLLAGLITLQLLSLGLVALRFYA